MNTSLLLNELQFKAIRSSGPGGQHVNKTSSKIELHFDVEKSVALGESEKDRIRTKLKNRITSEGILVLQCGETRSQHRNKAIVIQRLIDLLKQSLRKSKPRKKSKPSRSAIEKRLKSKKQNALKKANRKPPKIE